MLHIVIDMILQCANGVGLQGLTDQVDEAVNEAMGTACDGNKFISLYLMMIILPFSIGFPVQ
jgi:hypothetical protein